MLEELIQDNLKIEHLRNNPHLPGELLRNYFNLSKLKFKG